MANDQTASARQGRIGRLLGAAILINVAMGAIYAWGVFLLPLENYLSISRGELSTCPTVALIFFTAGMVLHDRLLRTLGRRRFCVLAFALAGGGHLLFAAIPAYWSLLVGYGGLFGFGSGLGYGLALALTSQTAPHKRALAIGITMAAFSSNGIVLPLALTGIVQSYGPAYVFGLLGVAILAIGGCSITLLWTEREERTDRVKSYQPHVTSIETSGWNFIQLAIIFFCICFVGLMTVSQLAGMVSAHGLDAFVGYSLSIFTLGYLLGSLLGGQVVHRLGGWKTLLLASLVTAVGLVFLDFRLPALVLIGAALIGTTFGSSASLMPTLVGQLYGVERIGEIYGRLMISYGLAGLVAPWGTGALYGAFGDYRPAIVAGLGMCLISGALAFSLRQSR
ncbi:hypothetical protein ASD12_26125 [Mesorhizobium sp. Root102]|uniref:MFS transporter n=1 Tax=Mesorhizobium sp. Root102 TaxID=1736422 RepID=UPI0006F9B8F9|nr:MFS transporter [Mesorhizobium sp. Root102]KQU92817.1 hypothetical protein ASD12_26125 [Mesorhizobium sp. Root102]